VIEGPQYKVSDVKLAGQMLVPEAELKELITIKPGEVFARDRLTETTKKIGDRLATTGMRCQRQRGAGARQDKGTVALPCSSTLAPVYVNRVNVAGNTRRAMKWCAARFARWRARITTPKDQPLARPAATALASSMKSLETPGCRHHRSG